MASFTCRATGNPAPQIEWSRNGRRIFDSGRFHFLNTTYGSTLRIDPVKELQDSGDYECVAVNYLAREIQTSKATLEVVEKFPTIFVSNSNYIGNMKDCVSYNPNAKKTFGYSYVKFFSKIYIPFQTEIPLPKGFPYIKPERLEPKVIEIDYMFVATLECDARGDPKPQITWFKDYQPVDLSIERYTLLPSGNAQK